MSEQMFSMPETPAPTETEKRPEAAVEHPEKIEKLRRETLILCPDNDAESHMILLLAEKAGMRTIRSVQRHGATLERETDVVSRATGAEKPNVWIVEIPGPETEEELRAKSLNVRVIDHHRYGELDRVTDPATGDRRPSSLEQFLNAAGVTDEELVAWGYDPKTVRGLGIMDDKFVQGLRDAGYDHDHIVKVLDQSERFSREMNPAFEEIRLAALEDWKRRERVGPYTVVRSDFYRDIRGAVAYLTIREGVDTNPLIVSSKGGEQIFVQNVPTDVVDALMERIHGKTFSYGAGRCWGVDNRGQEKRVTLEEILEALEDSA